MDSLWIVQQIMDSLWIVQQYCNMHGIIDIRWCPAITVTQFSLVYYRLKIIINCNCENCVPAQLGVSNYDLLCGESIYQQIEEEDWYCKEVYDSTPHEVIQYDCNVMF